MNRRKHPPKGRPSSSGGHSSGPAQGGGRSSHERAFSPKPAHAKASNRPASGGKGFKSGTPSGFSRTDNKNRNFNRIENNPKEKNQFKEPAAAPASEAQRHFRARHQNTEGPVWLYGHHACLAALFNPARMCRRLVVTREGLEALKAAGNPLPAQPQAEIQDKARLDSLLPPGAVHQGVALLAEPLEDPGIESLEHPSDDGTPDILLVLDQVTDPRNIGAILRSAAAFGARAVIVTDRHAPEATGALAKAASGGLEVVPLLRVGNLARSLDQLAQYGYWRVGLAGEAEKPLADAVKDIARLVLVLGAEDEGLRRLTREHCDFLARLPMSPKAGAVESLNVANAAAVALYEAVRR